MKKNEKNKSYNWNLRLFLTIVPFVLALLFVSFLTTSRALIKNGEANLELHARKNAESLDNWLNKIESQMTVYRSAIECHCPTAEQYCEYLKSPYIQSTDFSNGIYIGDAEGDYYDASLEEAAYRPNIANSAWYINGACSTDFVYSDLFMDTLHQKTCITISSRLDNPDKIYVIASDVYVDYAEQLVNAMATEPQVDGAILVCGKNNKVIVDSYTKATGHSLDAFSDRYGNLCDLIRDGKTGFFKAPGTDGKKYYVIITALENTDWYLVSYVKTTTITTPLYHTYIWLFVFTILIMAGLLIALLFTGKKMKNVQNRSVVSREINEAIAKSYIAVAYLHLDNSTFEEVWFQPQIRELIGRKGRALSALNQTIYALATETFIPRLETFTDLITLDDRLFNKQSVSIEFYGRTDGWCRASFIPVQTDEFGRLHTVLYTIQKQEGELLELRDKLNVEDTLLECVRTLSSYNDVDESIQHLLGIIADYHTADRAYIFRVDAKNQILINTHEWTRPGITSEIINMQKLPMSTLERWFPLFKKDGFVQISQTSTEVDKNSPEYTLLSSQRISSLYAVPFIAADGAIIGFLGVDNPTGNKDTNILLKSVSSFIQEELLKKQYTDELYALSYTDKMTDLKNRHAYHRDLEELNNIHAQNVGVVFADVNGLKTANDEHGHEQGDLLIQNASTLLKETFHKDTDSIYRIGGDEFVVFCRDITEREFNATIENLLQSLGSVPIMSIGDAWISVCDNLENQIKAADERMYARKSLYYTLTGKNRRKN